MCIPSVSCQPSSAYCSICLRWSSVSPALSSEPRRSNRLSSKLQLIYQIWRNEIFLEQTDAQSISLVVMVHPLVESKGEKGRHDAHHEGPVYLAEGSQQQAQTHLFNCSWKQVPKSCQIH